MSRIPPEWIYGERLSPGRNRTPDDSAMQKGAKAPIAGWAPPEARDPPDAPPCPPSSGRNRRSTPTSPYTRMEPPGPCRKRRNAPAENHGLIRHIPKMTAAPAQQIAAPDDPVPAAWPETSPDARRQLRTADSFQDPWGDRRLPTRK